MDLLREYWWLILVVLGLALLGFVILRPRQRVTLTDSAPLRPHMHHSPSEEVAAVIADVGGEILGSPEVEPTASDTAGGDDLSRMKGVGPKFAAALNHAGIHRFDQLASLAPEDASRIDGELGAFGGRLARDRVIEQARYLAAGDQAGFEAEFGKL